MKDNNKNNTSTKLSAGTSTKLNAKLVPRLRFPEFQNSGTWEAKRLGEVLIKNTKKNTDGQIKLVESVSNKYGFVKQDEYFEDRIVASKDLKNYYVIEKGVFAYNPSRIDVGSLAYKDNDTTSVVSPLYVSFRANKLNVNDYFLLHWFSTYEFISQMKISLEGGVRNTLSYENLSLIKIPLPTLPEQEKIAACLSSLDELITAEKQKLELLKDHKKGLLQNLFPQEGETVPKLRFPEFQNSGEWVETTLMQVADFVNNKTQLENLSINSYISTENLLPDFAGVVLASKLPSSGNFTKYQKGDILVSNIRPYLKKVWFADKDGACSNDVIVIRATSFVSSEFLSSLLRNDAFINFIMKNVEGVKMPRGDKDSIRKYPIVFPKHTKEQQKIADCLSSLDDLISAQTQKIEALEQHKKGLLQNLFPNTVDAMHCVSTLHTNNHHG